VSKAVVRDIATQYQRWVIARATEWHAPLVQSADGGTRRPFVDRYFRRAAEPRRRHPEAREPARILVGIGKNDRSHLQYDRRWVDQYNFCLLDRDCGRMFVRLCPYFPFSARVCSTSTTGWPIGSAPRPSPSASAGTRF
jgi:hypothetical protein